MCAPPLRQNVVRLDVVLSKSRMCQFYFLDENSNSRIVHIHFRIFFFVTVKYTVVQIYVFFM